ncbi:hypothetical protein Tco_1137904 [Tanacetum coccineum]
MIKSFPRGTSCGRDGLRAHHLMDCLSGAVIAIFDELVSSITQVVNLFLHGKCPQDVGRLVFKVSTVMIGHSLYGYFDDLHFGFGVSGGGDAILHVVGFLGVSLVPSTETCGELDIWSASCLMSTWMAFRGNTGDLGSFGEETDEIIDLYQDSPRSIAYKTWRRRHRHKAMPS